MTKLRDYEVIVVLSAQWDEDNRKEFVTSFTESLTQGEGEETKPVMQDWGKRILAYPIRKQTDAFYIYYDAQIDPASIRPIERNMNFNEHILRYLFVRKEDK